MSEVAAADATPPDIGRGIGFLGGGHMGRALVAALRGAGVDPQHIIVSGKYRSRAKSTGRDFEMETIHLWTAENGMLTRFNHYCDTAIVSAALEHRVPQYPDK